VCFYLISGWKECLNKLVRSTFLTTAKLQNYADSWDEHEARKAKIQNLYFEEFLDEVTLIG